MAGRIREEDIALVRERADLAEIIGAYVTLKPAGGGALKGLCPFHDEKSPSFHVRPGRGYHCFGCGEGGDVISFLMNHDGLTFTQAVEYLADRTGVTLRLLEGGPAENRPKGPGRQRLLEAHREAQRFYAEHLTGADAVAARAFLDGRGFDRDAAEAFGVGFAPRDGNALYRHLRQLRFTDAELVTAGLVAEGRSGHYDRFRGRVVWPIREVSGETIGFGARRIFEDDRIEAKYLNTPETPIYKKSQVLYGVDRARRDIARSSQAVVVEGYTDVMACHLAGVTTAVASCGTAFGEDHGRVLRRLLHDHEEFRGEIIFTFDGDEAGQKAALKAFEGDQQFVGQTYVAVSPDGLDPCDLRLKEGDEAVRELVARRVPLYRFVLGNVVSRFDLDRADGRVDALRAGARLVSSVRDRAKVEAFARELAGMVGVEMEQAREEVRRAGRQGPPTAGPAARPSAGGSPRTPAGDPGGTAPGAPPVPDLRDPRFALERETLKLTVQQPQLVARFAGDVDESDFTHPSYAAVWAAVAALGGPQAVGDESTWADRLRDRLVEQFGTERHPVLAAFNAVAVESPLSHGDVDEAYVRQYVFRLQEVTAMRAIAELKSKLQRTNPVEQASDYNRMFGDLVALESHRRALRERAIGAGT